MATLAGLGRIISHGHRVTLISPGARHYYSGMGPGMLGGRYGPGHISFAVQARAESAGAAFIAARVERIDAAAKRVALSCGGSLGYDILSCNTGSRASLPAQGCGKNSTVFTAKPIDELLRGRDYLLSRPETAPLGILVMGGGPAGLEIAGNLWRLLRGRDPAARITLVAGRRLLGRFPEKARRLARASLASRGIAVLENSRVERLEQGHALLESGNVLACDVCFAATGVSPSPVFGRSGIRVARDGGMLVNRFLQSVSHPDIFGGGDCISCQDRPLDRVGVHAVRQGPVLFRNLLAALDGKPLQAFRPRKAYLLLFNLGDGRAILCRKSVVFEGRLCFALKEFLDKRFMKTFQRGEPACEGAV